jgi:hypothetical protein
VAALQRTTRLLLARKLVRVCTERRKGAERKKQEEKKANQEPGEEE